MAIWTYEMAKRLAQQHNVTVYSRGGRFRWRAQVAESVRYEYVPAWLDRQVSCRIAKTLDASPLRRPYFASGWYFIQYAVRIALHLRRQRADVVHITNFSQFAPIVRAMNPEGKIVLHMHCEWLTQLNKEMIARRLRTVDLVIGCSEHVTQKIRERFPWLEGRCRTAHNGVDIGHFGSAGDQSVNHPPGRRLLYVGRVSPEKGVHVLFDAYHRVRQRHPDVRLTVVGPNAWVPREFLVDLSDDPRVSSLGAFYSGHSTTRERHDWLPSDHGGEVVFAGAVPHARVAEAYRDADIVVIPSLSDALPLPALEAMASGRPVVGTRVGGIPEVVVDGETGLLVEPNDPDALARAIARLLEDASLRARMGKAARQRAAQSFTWEHAVQALLRPYREVLGAAA